MTVYSTAGQNLFAFGLSIDHCHECSVRLQKRHLVEHDREITGAGDILLDNVIVNFESVWHTLATEPQFNVVFVEWNKSEQCCSKLGNNTQCRRTHCVISVCSVQL